MLGSIGSILAVVGNLFSSFKGLIFLLLGVFVGLWLFEQLLKFFFSLPQLLGKKEVSEIKMLVGLGKKYGYELDIKAIKKAYVEKQREATFIKLAKKYGVEIKKKNEK